MTRVHSSEDFSLYFLHHPGELLGDPASYDSHSDSSGEKTRERSLRRLVVNDFALVLGSLLG